MNSTSLQIGVDDTIQRLNNQHRLCPEQNFALVGYSQGAGVIHGAMGPPGQPYAGGPAERPKLNQEVIPKIKALVMFGDGGFKGGTGPTGQPIPPFSPNLQEKLRQNCHQRDPVSYLIDRKQLDNSLCFIYAWIDIMAYVPQNSCHIDP